MRTAKDGAPRFPCPLANVLLSFITRHWRRRPAFFEDFRVSSTWNDFESECSSSLLSLLPILVEDEVAAYVDGVAGKANRRRPLG